MTAEEPDLSKWSPSKYGLFASFTVFFSVVLAFAAIETFLRYQHERFIGSESMDPGLVLFDSELGWKLSPGWTGSHRHHDFEVEYSLGMSGFRFDPYFRDTRPNMVVLGDSFTFGLGVGDGDTFVARLNADGPSPGRYVNRGVIGYSTDQELLLLRQILSTRPVHEVLLVTYLGNDLFDNELDFPLQADHGKPFYRLDAHGRPVLENTPVPQAGKPARARGRSLAGIVLGDGQAPAPVLTRIFGDLRVFQRTGIFQEQAVIADEFFAERFAGAIELYLALIGELKATLSRQGGRLTVVLLPGASFVNDADNLSAQYQDYLRRRLNDDLAARLDASVIDAALPLRRIGRESGRVLYFPNEGHLTADGHAEVASLLAERL